MLSQKITKSTLTGNDTTIDCPGIRHILHNNVSFKLSTQRDTLNMGTSTNTFNSFSPGIGVVVNGADFVSIYESELIKPRKEDGSLPDMDFMKLVSSSDLIDKGRDVGFPYYGVSPDLGAFEYYPPTAVNNIESEKAVFFPNPVQNQLFFNDNSPKEIEIFNPNGVLLMSGTVENVVDLLALTKGIYFIRVKSENNKNAVSKIIKL